MKIIVAGSRTIVDQDVVNKAMLTSGWSHVITEVVSGVAPGVDQMGQAWAIKNNIRLKKFPANWELHGRAAGPIRNKQMAEYADALIAVWDGKSSGTKDMIKKMQKAGKRVYVVMPYSDSLEEFV